jgi:hypothetical protein
MNVQAFVGMISIKAVNGLAFVSVLPILFFDRVIGEAGIKSVQGIAPRIGRTKRRCRRDGRFSYFAFIIYKVDVDVIMR